MPKTRINCPNCRQPVVADIDQLFDVTANPSAKQRFMSGAFNVLQCQSCGYQGMVATPLVYHDADKELLMTFVPPELGLPRDEQERMLGSLINQVVNQLPQEKRKGYLLNPQSALTMQGMIERVLEGEGITKEMIQAQQQRMGLLRRLVSITDEAALQEVATQEDALIDAEFFMLMSRLIETSMGGGDQESARRLIELQKKLLPVTTYGRQVQVQQEEIQATITELQALGKDLTREKFLDLLMKSTSETRMSVLVSLARPVMDYQFFQLLSEKIEQTQGEEKERLIKLRPLLLEMTQEIDRQMDARQKQARSTVESILQASDLNEAIMQNLSSIDDFFMQELGVMLEEARRQGNLDRSAKINQIGETLQQLSTPPEMALVEEYLDLPDDAARQQFLQANQEKISVEFLEILGNVAAQVEPDANQEALEHVRAANRQALRFSMSKNLGGS